MTVYFYGRNSDVESFDRQSSIQTQLSKCKSYANIKDLKIDVEITNNKDGISRKFNPMGRSKARFSKSKIAAIEMIAILKKILNHII